MNFTLERIIIYTCLAVSVFVIMLYHSGNSIFFENNKYFALHKIFT